MAFGAQQTDRLDRLEEQLRLAPKLVPSLFGKVIADVWTRIPVLRRSRRLTKSSVICVSLTSARQPSHEECMAACFQSPPRQRMCRTRVKSSTWIYGTLDCCAAFLSSTVAMPR